MCHMSLKDVLSIILDALLLGESPILSKNSCVHLSLSMLALLSLMYSFTLVLHRKVNFTSTTLMGSNRQLFFGKTCQGSFLRVTATPSTLSLPKPLLGLSFMQGGQAGEERDLGQKLKP